MEEVPQQEEKKGKNENESPLKTYSRYSGIAVQMIIIILASVWGGRKLDELAGTGSPVFTAVLSLIGVVAAIYTAIKDLLK